MNKSDGNPKCFVKNALIPYKIFPRQNGVKRSSGSDKKGAVHLVLSVMKPTTLKELLHSNKEFAHQEICKYFKIDMVPDTKLPEMFQLFDNTPKQGSRGSLQSTWWPLNGPNDNKSGSRTSSKAKTSVKPSPTWKKGASFNLSGPGRTQNRRYLLKSCIFSTDNEEAQLADPCRAAGPDRNVKIDQKPNPSGNTPGTKNEDKMLKRVTCVLK